MKIGVIKISGIFYRNFSHIKKSIFKIFKPLLIEYDDYLDLYYLYGFSEKFQYINISDDIPFYKLTFDYNSRKNITVEKL